MMNDTEKISFITGNSFPLSLVRRAVTIRPVEMSYYLELLKNGDWESFWGHENTLAAVRSICSCDLTPKTARPAVTVNSEGYPELFGKQYRKCLVLSPEYEAGFRPVLNSEVPMEKICGWQVLEIDWE